MQIRLIALLTACCIANAHAQQGFFLDSWKAKSIVAPPFNEISKPTASATTTVSINISNVITRVSPFLFGNNANPYMTQMITEPVLIDHIKNLSPNIIRFPGGNISSVYFWNAEKDMPPVIAPDSLYDSDGKAVKAFYWYGRNNEGWTLSVANYYKMLQQTNSTGIITTNYSFARYGLGDDPVADAAHLAANWVRYDSGRTKYWEIGNEDAGPWQAGFKINTVTNKDGQPEIINGNLYGRHFRVFADSMRKAAAETGLTIHIGAQLIQADPANSWNPVDRTWNQGYFSEAGNTADYYIVHSYYTPFAENTTAANILRSAADETKAIMEWMNTTTTRANVMMKPIALTEWNIFAEGSMQAVSHINGLHASLVLGELIKNKYGMAARWDLANGWNNGNDHGTFSAGDEPGAVAKWNPRPSFFHMYYFQKYFGDQMLQSNVTGSADIAAYASSFSSGQIGTVIVNKGTTAQVVQMQSDGFVTGRYYWYTLTGDTDNGEFSRKVLVNGAAPAGVAGGPLNYATIKANSAVGNGMVKLSVPPWSAVYLLMEKGQITSIPDIDPTDKLVKLFPNPATGGKFSIRFSGITPNHATIQILNANGQVIRTSKYDYPRTITHAQPLLPGVYRVMIQIGQGTTIKNLVVP